jgi:hypothetical protein
MPSYVRHFPTAHVSTLGSRGFAQTIAGATIPGSLALADAANRRTDANGPIGSANQGVPIMDEELQTALETMVDEHGLNSVVDALAMVAFKKGEHLKSNWQESQTAGAWEKAGGCIAKLASKIDL